MYSDCKFKSCILEDIENSSFDYDLIDLKTAFSSLFFQNKVCDFIEDCADYSDEATCPDMFQFDNCLDNYGDKMCWWKEEPVDQLDWIIAAGNIAIKSL